MRSSVTLAAAIVLLALANSASAQASGSNGIFSLNSFKTSTSIISNLMPSSRPSSTPFTSLTNAGRFLPSFPSFQNQMTQRTATGPRVRFVSIPPPKK